MTNTIQGRRQQSGRSMIEMLGVLAIMGVITVGAIAMISAAMRSQKRDAVQSDAAQIATGVRALLGEYDDYSNIDNATIFAAIGMPAKNPYGGKYELAANPADPRQFVLTIGGLNESDCLYFKGKAWSDSVEYQMSDGRQGGATASPENCAAGNGRNIVKIIYN
jgi:type II secretory pathway pseudopilin PulG